MSEIDLILKNKLDTTFNILLELEFMKRGIVDVSNEGSKYFANSSRKSQFLNTTFKAFSKLLTIELYNLLDVKSDYNLADTLNYCRTNYDKIAWTTKPELTSFNRLEKKLIISPEILANIKTLRDKFYAHVDKNRFNYTLKIDQKELWQILTNLQFVFRILCADFNGTCWIFPIQYKGTPELRMISNYVDLKRLILHSKVEGKESIAINELEGIIRN